MENKRARVLAKRGHTHARVLAKHAANKTLTIITPAQVVVPPELAYGKYGTENVGGIIPAEATLIYDLELLKLAPLEISADQQAWIDSTPLPF